MKNHKKTIEKYLPHFIGLLLFSILPIFAFDRNNDRSLYWMYSYYYQLLFMVVAFYVNYLVITPRFFFVKRKAYFFSVMFAFAVVLLITSQYFYDYLQLDSLRPETGEIGETVRPTGKFGLHPKLADNFFLMVVVLGFSSGLAIIQKLKKNERQQTEIKRASVESELAFLKNQISPHFFFNSLNNIYALIAIDGDKAQKAVEKLSGLMRYLIYESDISTVQLKKEFDFMQNYIDLMQQRLSTKVKLDVSIQQDVPALEIPPLIFIPFVENAFKHGISYRSDSFIKLSLNIEGSKLKFKCENSISKNGNKEQKEKGGLGIVNIKRRLSLLYGDKAKLTQSQKDDVYMVELIIPLNS